MKKIFFYLFLLYSLQNLSAQTASVRGLYVDGFSSIIGNATAEDSLLTYSSNNNFNYLTLYDLWPIHVSYDLTNVSSSSILADFIRKAKQIYGITQIGAPGENFFFFNNVINVYNQLHTDPLEKIDVYNVEFEFWNTTSVGPGDYYCVTYLQPAGFSCDTAGAFSYYKTLLHQVDSLGDANGVMSETYVGWFNTGQGIEMGDEVDRILLHDYISNNSALYSYVNPRLQALAARNILTTVIPIFSAEPAFMGPWISTNLPVQAYTDLNSYLTSETGTWKQYIDLAGYQWFAYSFMPENLFTTGIEESENSNVKVFPNPARDLLTISSEKALQGSVQLYSAMGERVYETEAVGFPHAINLHEIPSGIYHCVLMNGSQRQVFKVIIIR
ncbi:MAG: T9SS type A sorting domain-containing protein [Bacteroidota bacterium]|nr:T9SS type A sorting domain-containing protein [Bacteroidota bacterium]